MTESTGTPSRFPRFARTYGLLVLPLLIAGVVVFDWQYPIDDSAETINARHPGQLRLCFAMAAVDGNEVFQERYYVLLPFSLTHLRAVHIRRPYGEAVSYEESGEFMVYAGAIFGFSMLCLLQVFRGARVEGGSPSGEA